MKVVQIVESFAYGTAKSVKQLVGILKRDHDVTVFYGERDGTGLEQYQLDPGVRWLKLPGAAGPLRHATNLRFLLKHVPNETGVIHGHSSFGGAYAKALGIFRPKSRILYSPRGYAFLRADYSWLNRQSFWLFERMSSRLCQTVACGPSELSYAKAMCAHKSMQIGNGWTIPPDVDSNRVGSGVVTVGRISVQKGFDLLLEIARMLPAVQFDWIGSEEDGVESMRQNVPPNVNIIDYMPHKEVLQKIRDARFVLLPSRWEGLSRFLVESVCLGKAIVTSECAANVDCLRENESGYQNGFKCGTTEEYVAAIEKLLQDEQLVRDMQQASHNYAKRSFDIESISQQWRDLYSASDRLGQSPNNSKESQALLA